MKKTWLTGIPAVAVAVLAIGTGGKFTRSEASDHDDGETDIKARALNLTDHFAFKSPSAPDELALVMYFSPRSLPGRQYFMSTNARYEFHVSKAASKTSKPTLNDSYIFRFEAKEPDAGGVQDITLTVFKDGVQLGSPVMGKSTDFANSAKNTVTENSGTAGSLAVKYFVGMRADSFHFDVNRFFQVRAFLASRFFGGAGGTGNAGAALAPNCRGDQFLAISAPGVVDPTKEAGGVPDADIINLFNPPACAPDFTKNLNVIAIALNVKIADLGGDVFDTWSTIWVKN